jgi:hypothetical protein
VCVCVLVRGGEGGDTTKRESGRSAKGGGTSRRETARLGCCWCTEPPSRDAAGARDEGGGRGGGEERRRGRERGRGRTPP